MIYDDLEKKSALEISYRASSKYKIEGGNISRVVIFLAGHVISQFCIHLMHS